MSVFHSGIEKKEIMELLKDKKLKIHFTGAGGVGIFSLLKISARLGYTVSGSDRDISPLSNRLIDEGYNVYIGHSEENARDSQLLVYTLALSEDNPELKFASDNKIPAVSRAEYLGALMENYGERISVSGSHGKSTTTAMISKIFEHDGKNPTVILGANLPSSHEPLRFGSEELLVFEGCEYKDSFLRFSPTATVFTNLELDHIDYFPNIEALKLSFLKAMGISHLSVVNLDDKNLSELIPYASGRVVTYGESENADYRAVIEEWKKGYYSLEIRHAGIVYPKIKLSVPGRFNAMNALGAAAVALEYSVSERIVKEALEDFFGIERRLEKIGEYKGNQVYYDYAHHPTEIKSAIECVREMTGKGVYVIFKPHTYSRTAGLMDEFVKALSLADRVFLCEISAIRERAIHGVSSDRLASMIGTRAIKIRDEDVRDALSEVKNSAIIIMGAANLDTVKKLIVC